MSYNRGQFVRRRTWFLPFLDALESRQVLSSPTSASLNQQVVDFANSHLGDHVGGGECAHLVEEALRVAGANFLPQDPGNGDYIWGQLVTVITPGHDSNPTVACVPGDIIQYQNVSLSGGSVATHHTAIVGQVDSSGRPTKVYEENSGGDRHDRYDPDVINSATVTAGTIHIYRPTLRTDTPGQIQYLVVNDTTSRQNVTIYFNGQASQPFSLDVFDTVGSELGGTIPTSGFSNIMIGVDGHEVPITNAGGYEVYSTGTGASIRALNYGGGASMLLTGPFLTDGTEARAEPAQNKSMTFDKVIQGDSDTCAFDATLSAVALSNFNLASGISVLSEISPTDIVYNVRLYEPAPGGETQPVEVPVEFNGTFEPGDARSSDPNEFWPTLYQRAYLSLENSIGQAWQNEFTAFQALTGLAATTEPMADVTPAALSALLDDGTPVATATESSADAYNLDPAQGVIGSHGYTVVGIASSGGTTDVTLRNPWGQNSTPEYASSIGSANDGIITIPWTTFTQYYTVIVSVPISGPSINFPQGPGPTFNNSYVNGVNANAGQTFTLDLSAVAAQGGTVYYSLIGQQVGSLSSAGTFTWTPGPNDVGNFYGLEVLAQTSPTTASTEYFGVEVGPSLPTVGGLVVNPTSTNAAGTDKVTLQATNVSAPEGTLFSVEFSLDIAGPDGSGLTETALGSGTAASNWTWSGFVGGLSPGTYTVSAVAILSLDYDIAVSSPVTATLTVTPAPDYEPPINSIGSEVRVAENAAPIIGLGTTIDHSGNVRVFWTTVPAPSTQFMSEYNSVGELEAGPVQLSTAVSIVELEQATFVGLPDGSFDEVYTSSGTIEVQKYSGRGVAQGGPIVAATGVQFDQYSRLQAAADGSGNLLIGYSNATENAYALTLSAAGQVTRAAQSVNSESSSKLSLDSVALNAAGTGVIVWTDSDQQAIIARRVTDAGHSSAADQFTVYQDPSAFQASAGIDANGDITFVYNTLYGIDYRRYSGDGTSDSGDQLVYTSVNDGPTNPRVAASSDGWAFVAWDDPKYDGYGSTETIGKLISTEGEVQGSVVPVPTDGIADIMGGVAMNDQGRIAVGFTNLYTPSIGGYAVNFSSFWADMQPVFGGPYQFTVPLESAAGTVVGTVQAIDPDGEEVSYSLLGSSAFSINATTGVITVADPSVLKSAAETSYTLTVQANDGYSLANVRPVTNVVITVDDPTPPEITSIPNWTIDAGESVVPVIQASDPDGSALSYSAAVGDGASATASVSGNDLTVTSAVGYTGTFPVTVTATNGLASGTTTFQVTVVTPSLAPVSDVTTRGPVSTTLNGSDASGAALTYSAAFTGGGSGAAPATLSIAGNVLLIDPTPGYAGTFLVTASVSDGPDTASRSFNVTVPQVPVPTITGLSRSSAIQGGGQFTLTVTGSNFADGSSVLWNGTPLATAFISPARLTATIPASDLAKASTASITVSNPGNTTSGFQVFTVASPPGISALSPDSALEGRGQLGITVTGTGFVNGYSVLWNGVALPTVFVNSTTLTATIPAADLGLPGEASVTVGNGADIVSSAKIFTLVQQPRISGLSPAGTSVGGGQFSLTVSGNDFVNGSRVLWNGTALTTVFINSTTLMATVPASDTVQARTASITVSNLGDISSSAAAFNVAGPPAIFGLSTASATQGAAQFTLSVTGTNFVNGSTVTWNGAALSTSFVSAGALQAIVPALDLARAGIASVAVGNPGNVTSSATLFTIIGTGRPQVTNIMAGSHSGGGLISIIVWFNEPMNLGSVQSAGSYTVKGAVKKRGRVSYSKSLGFRVIYDAKSMSATITLSAASKGGVQVTVKSGIKAANGLSTAKPTKHSGVL